MSLLLSAGRIAEEALRSIGALAPYDSAADEAEFKISLARLDLVVAQLVGTERLAFLTPAEAVIELVPGQRAYDINAQLGSAALELIDRAVLRIAGRDMPLPLIRREEYDDLPDKESGGRPEVAYIERRDRPTMFLHPVPAIDGATVRLTGQTFATDQRADQGKQPHGFPAAWQLLLVNLLSASIGNGPVRKLSKADINDFRAEAQFALGQLRAFNGREHADRPRFTAPTDF